MELQEARAARRSRSRGSYQRVIEDPLADDPFVDDPDIVHDRALLLAGVGDVDLPPRSCSISDDYEIERWHPSRHLRVEPYGTFELAADAVIYSPGDSSSARALPASFVAGSYQVKVAYDREYYAHAVMIVHRDHPVATWTYVEESIDESLIIAREFAGGSFDCDDAFVVDGNHPGVARGRTAAGPAMVFENHAGDPIRAYLGLDPQRVTVAIFLQYYAWRYGA
jgi:hypothetical protein